MQRAEHVLAFDLATRTGFAFGSVSEYKPRSGAVSVKNPKKPDVPYEHNIGALFIDLINGQRPDIVVWEVPITVEGWLRQPAGRRQNGASLIMQNVLAGILCRECFRKGIPYFEVDRKTAMKHFTGRGSWVSAPKAGDGRANGKKACLDVCVKLGWLPFGCKDDDRSDALTLWSWAAGTYGKAIPKEIMLFDQGKMAHSGG